MSVEKSGTHVVPKEETMDMNARCQPLTRREWMCRAARTVGGLAMGASLAPLFASPATRRFKIGTCDWSLGKTASPAALEVAKQIGFDGVQVSLGTLADNMQLRQSAVQQQYRDTAARLDIEISSLGIGEMNNIPYKSDPRPVEWVRDCIDVMQALRVKVTLLAFFGKGNLKGDKEGVEDVVRRIKKIKHKAEKAGVILGIESYLSADEHLDILQRVGSPAVQVYYDVSNSIRQGYDIYKEIRQLGRRHICEFHMKEKGVLLGQGRVDYHKVREAIDDIGYSGWMQIEDALPKGTTVQQSYATNLKFLRQLFPD